MKKEIPRMLKSSSIVYAFDCFGTVFSSVPAFKFFKKSVCSFNPKVCDIRWIMTVPDSFWYRLKAKLICIFNGVSPVEIVKYRISKSKSEQAKNIYNLLKDISDQKDIIKYVDPKKVKKVVYVNNNLKLDDEINQMIDRMRYDIVAVNLIDFWEKKFEHLM